jgi:hypothetical protein
MDGQALEFADDTFDTSVPFNGMSLFPDLAAGLADPDVFSGRLVEAGLAGVSVRTLTWELRISSASHFWNLSTSSNPIGARLVADLGPDQRSEVLQVLDGMLRERAGGGHGAVLHTEVNIGTGSA